jgi:hypothetical protein
MKPALQRWFLVATEDTKAQKNTENTSFPNVNVIAPECYLIWLQQLISGRKPDSGQFYGKSRKYLRQFCVQLFAQQVFGHNTAFLVYQQVTGYGFYVICFSRGILPTF